MAGDVTDADPLGSSSSWDLLEAQQICSETSSTWTENQVPDPLSIMLNFKPESTNSTELKSKLLR